MILSVIQSYATFIQLAICCNGLLYVFPTRNIVNFFINLILLTATYLSKARYSLFVLKVPLNHNQSILRAPQPYFC